MEMAMMRCWVRRSRAQSWRAAELELGVIHHFKKVVRRQGSRVALCDGPRRLSYTELDEESDRVASAIQSCGLAQGPIAVGAAASEELVIALVGILKSGRAYLVLPRGESDERLLRQVERAGVVLLLSGEGVPGWDLPQLTLEAARRANPVPLPLATGDGDLAIVFTSGQSAVPGAVRRTQRSLLHQVAYLSRVCDVRCDDRVAMMIPASFGSCSHDVFLALLTGACLCPFSFAEQGSAAVAAWLARERITFCHCVPSVYRAVMDRLPEGRNLPHLRWFKLGGEPLFRRDVEFLRARLAERCRILHSYGATETGGTIAARVLDRRGVLPERELAVGAAIPGKSLTIVDASGEAVDAGVEGEIVVRSRYLAAGYLDGLQRGGARFVAGPTATGESVFLTGDLGHLDGEGNLHHEGRIDGQVKLRGVRVPLAEMEARCLEHPWIAACALIPDTESGRLEFCVGLAKDAPLRWTAGEVAEELRRGWLADAVPISRVHVLDDWPITPNGKVDRQALRLLLAKAPELIPLEQVVPPRSAMEQVVWDLWARLLGRSDFGVYESFFALGGDSLMAVEFQAELIKQLGTGVPAAVLLGGHPVLAVFAEQLQHDCLRSGYAAGKGPALNDPLSPMVMIRQRAEGPVIAVLPGGYGGEAEMMLFARMVEAWPPEAMVVGFRASVLYQCDPRPKSVEEVAAVYGQALEQVAAGRRLVIVGHCIAGPVALELARQWRGRQRWEAPVPLVLIDSAWRRGWLRRGGSRPPVDHPSSIQGYFDLLDQFTPDPYEGDATLLVTATYDDGDDPALGWDQVVDGQLKRERLASDHHEVVRADSGVLARRLGEILTQRLNSGQQPFVQHEPAQQ